MRERARAKMWVTLEDLPGRRTFTTVFGHCIGRCNGEGPCQGEGEQNVDQRPHEVHCGSLRLVSSDLGKVELFVRVRL